MGEGEREQHDAQEANNVRRCPQENWCRPTRSMGESENRKENCLTAKLNLTNAQTHRNEPGRFHYSLDHPP
jgi:hypothetical protein